MSMLAERKRKQKWSLNPRGKDWAQDTSKFGHKMLERMGWSQGKGLGARENGITEHIKVSYKNDSKGLGHKERNDQWTEHESNFSALLSSLGGTANSSDILKVSSLEEKSKKSRARVHYRKFTRGKDLSKYSEKDLANIFGKKSLDELKKSDKNNINNSNEENQPVSSFSVNSGLINDYFKKKLPNFGNINGFVVGNNGVLKKPENSDSESDSRPSFGFGIEKAAKVLGLESEEATTPKKNKKKRTVDDIVEDQTPSKKKKAEIYSEKQNHAELGLSNPAFDPMHSTPVKLQKHQLDVIEESISEESIEQQAEHLEVSVQIHENSPNKRRKKKKLNESNVSNSGFEESPVKTGQKLDFSEDSLDISSNRKAKKNRRYEGEDCTVVSQESFDCSYSKKKNKKNKIIEIVNGLENPYFNASMEAEEQNSGDISKSPKKKSKKDKKEVDKEGSGGVENPFFNISIESNDICSSGNNPHEVKVKKKKNKNKMVEEQEAGGIDNPFLNISIESEDISSNQSNPYEIKVKKKKNNKKKHEIPNEIGLEDPTFDNDNVEDSPNEKFEVKRKKSKKEHKKEEASSNVGVDNPALNLSVCGIEENGELMLNIATTPVNSNVNRIQNNYKSKSSVQRRKSVRFSDVTRERIIPTKEEIKKMEESQDSDIELDMQNDSFDIEGRLKSDGTETFSKLFRIKKKSKKKILGLDNQSYDAQKNNLEENLDSISKTLDQYQAELENDINEAKMKSVEISDIMIGEVGDPDGENEALPDGSVKLKFKHAKFGKNFKYHDTMLGPKKPYRHLIKGDITLDFKDSNLHEIQGYALEKTV